MGSAIEFKVLAQSHQLEPNLDRGQSTGHGSSDPIRMHVLLLAFWAADLHTDVQLDFLSRNRSSFIFRKPTHGQRWLSLYFYRVFIPFHSMPTYSWTGTDRTRPRISCDESHCLWQTVPRCSIDMNP